MKIVDAPNKLPPGGGRLKPIRELSGDEAAPDAVRFSFRSFDRQFLAADARLIDRPSPALWSAHSDSQVYLTTLLNHPLGGGPALTAAANIPDLHHFRGSFGAKEAIPSYRDAQAQEPNILPGLLDLLGANLGVSVKHEDFVAFVYCMLAQPAFTARYQDELVSRELRVPITKDAALFFRARDFGKRLLWLHTYGQRLVPEGARQGDVPRGAARCTIALPETAEGYPERFSYDPATQTLKVGTGEFAPVAQEVFEFEISGLKAVKSWLKYRMKDGAGRVSSPLDAIHPERWTADFTTELLELLWVLEATVYGYQEQAELLEAVVEGPCFNAGELPAVPLQSRRVPTPQGQASLLALVEGDA